MMNSKSEQKASGTAWIMAGLAVMLAAGLAGCGSGIAPVVIPSYDTSWTEKAAADNGTQDKAIYYFDNSSVVAVKMLTSLTVDDFGIPGLGLPVLKRMSDTMVVGESIEGYRLTALYNGQTMTWSFNYKLLDGTLTRSGDNVTATYRYEGTISSVTGVLTTTTTYEGTRSADGTSIVFNRVTTQQTTTENGQDTVGDPVVTTTNLTWTLTSGNALK